MRSTLDPYRPYHTAVSIFSLTTAGIATLALLGWSFNVPILTTFVPGLASMKITTAFGFLCATTSVLVVKAAGPERRISRLAATILATVLSATAGLLGLGTLLSYVAGLAPETDHPGWMAPSTAVSFVLFALAVVTFVSEKRTTQRFSESAILFMIWINGIALVGYLYDEQSLYTFGPYASTALPTASAFPLLGAALLCVKPDRGFMAVILSQEAGGLMLRRMVPLTFGMVIIIGWLKLVGETLGWFDRMFGMIAVVGLNLGGFSVVLWIVARALTQADRQRSESEERLALANQATGIGTFDWHPDTGKVVWNRGHYDLFGIDPSRPSNFELWRDAVHPEDLAHTLGSVQNILDRGEGVLDVEYRIVRPDGIVRWVQGLGRLYPETEPGPKRMVGICMDITERKQAEEALRESELRFRTLVERIGDVFWISDPAEGKLVYVSQAFADIWGRDVQQLYDRFDTWLETIHEEDRERVKHDFFSNIYQGQYDSEYRVVRPDETIRWIRDHGKALGIGSLVAGVAEDITERKQVEEALQQSEERFRNVFLHAGTGIAIVGLDGCFVQCNPAYCDMLGYTEEELRHFKFHELVHPQDLPTNVAEIQRLIVEQAAYFEIENRYVHKHGEPVWAHKFVSLLRDHTGEPKYFVALVTNVTERRRAEQALREAQQTLQRWNVELEQTVNVKTAELMQSQARLRALASELTLAEQRERQRLATELHDHLQQMLVYGKMTIGQGKRRIADVPAAAEVLTKVDEVLSDALTYSRTLVAELSPPVLRDQGLAAGFKWLGEYMKKYNLTVTVVVPEQQEPTLPTVHRVLLFQSVRELLINASKHAGTGKATIVMEQRDEHLHVTVSDEGKGFDLAAAAAAAAGTPSGGISSKFGLFSIQERMRALGGSFVLESAPGQGTTATLVLPTTTHTDESTSSPEFSAVTHTLAPVSVKESSSLTKGRRIVHVLLVDDHAMMRQGLRSVLDAYEDLQVVAEARDGAEAVRLVGELRPQVVVMDINMPTMNGIEATTQITSHWPETTIIGISVNARDENSAAMQRAGAVTVLPKESAVDELHDAIVQEVGVAADE